LLYTEQAKCQGQKFVRLLHCMIFCLDKT